MDERVDTKSQHGQDCKCTYCDGQTQKVFGEFLKHAAPELQDGLGNIKPEIHISTGQSKDDVLTISQDDLIDDNHVYIKSANGKPEKREIVTGIKSDTEAEVLSGLNEGDRIVTNPQAVTAK